MTPELTTAHELIGLAAVCGAAGSLMIMLGGMEGFLLITFGFLLLVAGLLLLPLTLLTSSDMAAQPADQHPAPEPALTAEDPPAPAPDLDTDPSDDFRDQ